MPARPAAGFRLHHISTDEVFGSLGATGRFSETTPYDPRSPYSASKAASAHQLQQQLRPLAISREVGANVRDWLYVEDHVHALLRWEAIGSARTKRWWRRSAVRSMACCPLALPTAA